MWQTVGRSDLLQYLEDDVAVCLVELAMESFIHLDGNKVLYLPHCYTWDLEGGIERYVSILMRRWHKSEDLGAQHHTHTHILPVLRPPRRTQSSPVEASPDSCPSVGSLNHRTSSLRFPAQSADELCFYSSTFSSYWRFLNQSPHRVVTPAAVNAYNVLYYNVN